MHHENKRINPLLQFPRSHLSWVYIAGAHHEWRQHGRCALPWRWPWFVACHMTHDLYSSSRNLDRTGQIVCCRYPPFVEVEWSLSLTAVALITNADARLRRPVQLKRGAPIMDGNFTSRGQPKSAYFARWSNANRVFVQNLYSDILRELRQEILYFSVCLHRSQ